MPPRRVYSPTAAAICPCHTMILERFHYVEEKHL